MCWGVTATLGMTAIGAAATAVTLRRGDAPAIPLALGYFTLMEGLQLAGYAVIGQCDSPANQVVTLLSALHIVFQPFVINAFAMQLVPAPVRARARVAVHGACALSAVVMLLQLYPFAWAGACTPGATLCAEALCTVPGAWHIAWDIPYNGLLAGWDLPFGMILGFPTYVLAVFVMPVLYGAWRFALFHLLVGPVLAGLLTDNPNEAPAIWCLFSIGIVLMALSPVVRRRFEWRQAASQPA